ncbi:MAG: class I SAM-dependent methyltransferase [Alphaproteobacteria bacterium]|jgi:ubiquinone/menaquinone biosynthesis C-methylase UbiE|nr:class I SAM-dependent methyltransferase [Alphaproteobacteria bacterium]MDP6780296.1 class I SAM-dependent methyltransferase [Alphaproteobacteria bacterium]MDP7045254.1 class I SAM-dependent methyltransferase [Alphaproteobacteria bacterium]|tara:strand:+ start:52 stop:870 length:819 start_codon:yes stop_codon:yes gene_type:complete
MTSIKDAEHFWDNNPVHSIEIPHLDDLKLFSEKCDFLRWNNYDIFTKTNFYEALIGKGYRILDAGCGTGVCTRYYSRKGLDVHAIDISQKSVEINKKTLELNNLHATVKKASVEKIPYPNNFFDSIVSVGVIHHTENITKSIEEIYRVLKPGGLAFVSVNYKHILFRLPLWHLTKKIIICLTKKTDGRSKLNTIKTPEDLGLVYDGNDCPISNLYTIKQTRKMFSKFKILEIEPHYFPVRYIKLIPIKHGSFLHRIADNYFGTGLYCLLKKP